MLKKRFILVLGLSFMLSACGKAQNDVQDNTNSTMEDTPTNLLSGLCKSMNVEYKIIGKE